MASMVDEILSQIPADDLAQRLDTDPDTAMDAARKALPALLGGLNQEVQSGKADALGRAALQDHDESLLGQTNPLAGVDPNDGQKILGHIFGDQLGDVEQRLGGASRAEPSIFSKLLPMLAPIVMSWLSGKMGRTIGSPTRADVQAGGGGVLDDLLGSVGGGGGLGGLLGDLLGGEMQQSRQSMPDLGGLFDMFGGGDRSDDDRGERRGGVSDVGDLLG